MFECGHGLRLNGEASDTGGVTGGRQDARLPGCPRCAARTWVPLPVHAAVGGAGAWPCAVGSRTFLGTWWVAGVHH